MTVSARIKPLSRVFFCIALVSAAADAQAPSVDHLVAGYASMPWTIAVGVEDGQPLACVPHKQASVINYIVGQLAAAAKERVSCS
jgi:hypothetical protein